MSRAAYSVVAAVIALSLPARAWGSLSDVVARVSRSVVVVEAGDRQGSAFAYGPSGDFLTNAHVVEGAQQVVLVDPDGRRQDAKVIAVNPRADVAELQGTVPLAPLIPTDRAPRAGDEVLTIGAPGGLQGTVTEGIISALDRQVGAMSMIQADLAVNPGNSGGPLLTAAGQVLGITSEKASGEEGIAFAIPIATAVAAVRNPASTPGTPAVLRSRNDPPGLLWTATAVLTALAAVGLAVVLVRRRREVPQADIVVRRRAGMRVDSRTDPLIVIRRPSRRDNQEHKSTEEPWT